MVAVETWLQTLVGKTVEVDLDESYLVIGILRMVDDYHLEFDCADLHDHHEANCSKEVYVLESKQLGVRVNRTWVAVPRSRMLAISLLDGVQT